MLHPVTRLPVPLGLIGGPPTHPTTKLRLSDFRAKAAPAIASPAAVDITLGLPKDTDPLGNLDNGDCGLAGPGHNIIWMDDRAGRSARVTTKGVLAAWNAINGGTGEGVVADAVLAYWRETGICGCNLAASLMVDYNDPVAMTAAAFELGGIHMMFSLPKCVQGAAVWDVTKGDDGGVWGGHWVWAFAANELDGVLVNSWGQWIFASWAFVFRYAFDARCAISHDDLGQDGRAYSGLDMDGLRAAIASLAV
jgi:hypothetical protein